jgi:hypothetical protein
LPGVPGGMQKPQDKVRYILVNYLLWLRMSISIRSASGCKKRAMASINIYFVCIIGSIK